MYIVKFLLDFPSVFFVLPSVRRGKKLLEACSTFFLSSSPHVFRFFFPKTCDGAEEGYTQIVCLGFHVSLSFPMKRVELGVLNPGSIIVNTKKCKEKERPKVV